MKDAAGGEGHSAVQAMEVDRSGSQPCQGKPVFKKRREKLQFFDLPIDMQCKILSELTLKEVVRTSVLSAKWRSARTMYPKLRFDADTICSGRNKCWSKQHTEEFIKNVNSVLKEHNGSFVENFEVGFEFNGELVTHLDNWARFVAASKTKNLVLVLVPANTSVPRYSLPVELLDSGTGFSVRLQHIHLGFVSIKLPVQFSGFPNLRKLDLDLVHVTAKDLQDLLSTCSNLESLRIMGWLLHAELRVPNPLCNLRYLCVQYCNNTKIEFHAQRLKTFVLNGEPVPINLAESLELENVDFSPKPNFSLEHALTTLPKAFPSVKNLYIRDMIELKACGLLENICRFSYLRYLQLSYFTSVDENVRSLASLLRAAPFMEKLELHLRLYFDGHIHTENEPINILPRHSHDYLKDVLITGFLASKGQIELLVHIVSDAPALENLTVDLMENIPENSELSGLRKRNERFKDKIRGVASSFLEGKISTRVKYCFL